jgi:hypothetical protein
MEDIFMQSISEITKIAYNALEYEKQLLDECRNRGAVLDY